jgi:hypothetical protein
MHPARHHSHQRFCMGFPNRILIGDRNRVSHEESNLALFHQRQCSRMHAGRGRVWGNGDLLYFFSISRGRSRVWQSRHRFHGQKHSTLMRKYAHSALYLIGCVPPRVSLKSQIGWSGADAVPSVTTCQKGSSACRFVQAEPLSLFPAL